MAGQAGRDRTARDKTRAAFAAAGEGSLFDGADRRGVLHVEIKPQSLAAGFTVRVSL
jgi:hypothetical protein